VLSPNDMVVRMKNVDKAVSRNPCPPMARRYRDRSIEGVEMQESTTATATRERVHGHSSSVKVVVRSGPLDRAHSITRAGARFASAHSP
jgi:hypothetical protein